MTAAPAEAPQETGTDTPAGRPPGLRLWKEFLLIAVLYLAYSYVRNQFGSEAGDHGLAFDNARRVIDLERLLGSFHEETLQDWFLDDRWFIQFWNFFYGFAHFAVTLGALFWLFFRHPWRYVRWRTILVVTTVLALIGYATFPLMPPRLLPPSYSFVDTLRTFGGLWSFDDSALETVSNQYAAMPSLHAAWSVWVALAVFPVVRRTWVKVLVLLHPIATLFAITVTANHYWLDAAGGALCLAGGLLAGLVWDRWRAPTLRAGAQEAAAQA